MLNLKATLRNTLILELFVLSLNEKKKIKSSLFANQFS